MKEKPCLACNCLRRGHPGCCPRAQQGMRKIKTLMRGVELQLKSLCLAPGGQLMQLRCAALCRTRLLASNPLSGRRLLGQAARCCMANAGKRKMVTIGTHSGSFHCDEALGCWLLQHTDQFKDGQIVRSRDPEVLAQADIIIDVGGVYDEAACRFDHHQRGFEHVFGHGYNTKLSSAGLVYKHYGKQVVASILGLPMDHPDMDTVYLQVYKSFIEAVDAIDNGVAQYDAAGPPRYSSNTDLASRVGNLNPKWNEDNTEDTLYTQFLKAVALTGSEFQDCVKYIGNCWLPARIHVRKALEELASIDPSCQIMRLDVVCPWKAHLYTLEEEMGLTKPVLFCVYKDDREGKWRVQAVSVNANSFENRRSMPAAWRGLRDDKLSEVSGIPGCVFCHANGFIGGHATYEGALQMAKLSLTLE